ncbi:flagellin [Mariprofundus ferrooxydans]|uniref:flagellin N-terminal helical domain-containing protein n=1 Tax=Mariprofundus ferrooxydans TaxID=314344 RepID=UPI000361999F|nr:flagellin [Mariprofundus ferrooxydans]
MLSVQTNNAAVTALKNLNTNSTNMNNSLNRLSSGFRINSAADDSSGFAIASKLDAQASRLKAANNNATQATAMVKMADAGINEIQNMVSRIQTLATQAASANNAGELGKLDAERVKLEGQINNIANSTNYNGVNLLNGKDSTSAAVAGTASTMAASATMAGTGGDTATIAATGTALFNNAASFDIVTDATGKITSVKSTVDLISAADGSVLAAAGTELAGAANVAQTFQGITLTSTPGAGAAADTATIAATAGTTTAVAAGQTAYTAALAFQVGADNSTNNQVAVDLSKSYTATGLNLGSGTGSAAGGNLLTQSAAQTYIDTAKAAMNTLITNRADLGATQNQLGFVQANLATSIEQTTASVSSIKDADMASEMANFTKNKILTQAGTSMLAQANQASQNVLTLFR